MPGMCIVLSSDPGNSVIPLVRMLKSFRRGRCLNDAARRANLHRRDRTSKNVSVSHLTPKQQNTLRSKTHSHHRMGSKCRIAHCPPHCSRFLMAYPEVKNQVFAQYEIVVINVHISRRLKNQMRYGIPAPCNLDEVRCAISDEVRGAMEDLQTIVDVLHEVEKRKIKKNTRCFYLMDSRNDFDVDWWLSLSQFNKQPKSLVPTCSVYTNRYLPPYAQFSASINDLWFKAIDTHLKKAVSKNLHLRSIDWSMNLTSLVMSFLGVRCLVTLWEIVSHMSRSCV